jgi:hypothetical protein
MEQAALTIDSNAPLGRKTDRLKDTIGANIDEAEARHDERQKQTRKPRNKQAKPAEALPRKPAEEEETGTPEEPHGQGKTQAKAERKPKEPKVTESEEETVKPAGGHKQAKADPETDDGKDNPFAPKHWSQEERDAFAQAPKAVQEQVLKTVKNLQAGFTKKAMELGEARRVAEDFTTAFQPHHRARMQAQGLSESQMLRTFLQLDDAFHTDPVGYVQFVMQQARISPEQLLGRLQGTQGANPGSAGQSQDPHVAALQSELAAIKGVLTNAANQTRARQQQALTSQQQEVTTAIATFENAVDEAGNPAHPHFRDLYPQIVGLVASDPAIRELQTYQERLQAAYERAAWANPATRKALQEAEAARVIAEQERQRARSARSVTPRPGSGSGTPKPVIARKPNAKRGENLEAILMANASKFGA